MNTLKPCPFCGGAKICTEKSINLNYCDNCSAESNVEQWNTRPIEDALSKRIAELEAVIEILEDQQREVKNILIDKNLHIDSLYEEGFTLQQRIAELEEKQRWRVVANGELPNRNDYYLARDDLGQQGMILFYDGEWNKFTNLSYITHWMPLPESPKEREE